MEAQIEVLFFLDNPETALIEVGSGGVQVPVDAMNTNWYIYYKKAGLIKKFRFIALLSTLGAKQVTVGGILKITPSKKQYRIAIGIEILDFKEKPPQKLTQSALKKIEAYVNRL